MRKLLFITCFVVLLFGALPLYGEEAPEIVFESVDYDFDKVYQGEKVIHNFEFWNKGGSDLFIEKVRSSCGCTTALLSAKTIPPGGRGEIKATFSTRGRKGKQKKSITVISNDPGNGTAVLTISGEIVAPIQFVPTRVSLREVAFGEGKSEEVKLVLSEEFKNLEITEVSSTSPYIEVVMEKAELPRKKRGMFSFITRLFRRKKEEKEGEKESSAFAILHINIMPDAPKGRLSGRITVQYEGAKKGSTTIPVYARIVGNIIAKPERLFLGSISSEEGREASVVVSDRRGEKLSIKEIETGSEFLEVEQEPVDTSSIKLIVKVKSRAPEGVLRGSLKIFTDDADEDIVEVQYRGNVRRRTLEK